MGERDPYPKPATAKEAALCLVRAAIAKGRTPEELVAGRDGLYRSDYNAVVGQVFGANPPRTIAPDQVGVIGFDERNRGEVFSLAELWDEAQAEQRREVRQPRLFETEG